MCDLEIEIENTALVIELDEPFLVEIEHASNILAAVQEAGDVVCQLQPPDELLIEIEPLEPGEGGGFYFPENYF